MIGPFPNHYGGHCSIFKEKPLHLSCDIVLNFLKSECIISIDISKQHLACFQTLICIYKHIIVCSFHKHHAPVVALQSTKHFFNANYIKYFKRLALQKQRHVIFRHSAKWLHSKTVASSDSTSHALHIFKSLFRTDFTATFTKTVKMHHIDH